MSKIIELQPREINSIGGGKTHNPFVVGGKIFGVFASLSLLIGVTIATTKGRPEDKPNSCAEGVGFFAGHVAAGVVLVGSILHFMYRTTKSQNDTAEKSENKKE